MSADLDDAFDVDDDTDAQWFAWGVQDGATGSHRTPPERDGGDRDPDATLALRQRSFEAGIAAGEALYKVINQRNQI